MTERAADYIAPQLRRYGYQVAPQHFPILSFESRETVLSVREPEQRTLEASALCYSASGDMTAAIVDCGLGRP